MSLPRLWSRGAIYLVLIAFSLFYLMPFYVMFITGLKPYEDLNVTRMWELPRGIHLDGITEAWNTREEMLGEEGFCDLIARTTTQDLQGSVDSLVQALRSWCGERPFDDDVSLLAMDVTG